METSQQGSVGLGTLLDHRYRIERLLGEGAMGAVYAARHTGHGGRVAIKVIARALAGNDDLLSRFHREARAAGAIETQHIARVLDTGLDRELNLPFIAMEYLDGEDVQHLLQRLGPLDPELVVRIVAQACLGLQKAHGAQVVHRDIKPANLFLARRDAGEITVKLLDFGIAKFKDTTQESGSAALTSPGNVLGSPLYMSPEQIKGSAVDHRTDLWSLGVVLYQALTGVAPCQEAKTLGALYIAICSEPPLPVQQRAPWVPSDVAEIVHTALRPDPGQRFQSAEAMLQALRSVLPHGWSLTEEMLVPFSAARRAHAASRHSMSLPGVAERRHETTPGVPASPTATGHRSTGTPQPGALARSQSGTGQGRISVTGAGLAFATGRIEAGPAGTSAGIRPRRGGMMWVIALGGAFGAALLAGGILVVAKAPAPAVPVAPPVPPTVLPVVPEPPVEDTGAAPSPPSAPTTLRFNLLVSPPDVSVQVNGRVVRMDKGAVEISGAPGDSMMVWLRKGLRQTAVKVEITESGLVPPRIKLDVGADPVNSGPGVYVLPQPKEHFNAK